MSRSLSDRDFDTAVDGLLNPAIETGYAIGVSIRGLLRRALLNPLKYRGGIMSPYLSKPAREALARLAESDAAQELPDPLTRLRDIRSLLAELDNEPAVLHSVRDALATGATWDDIATAALLKPAAAKWRWQGTDEDILARQDAGRKRSARPSSVPTDLPGHSVADAARKLGVTAQAVYLQISRGKLSARTIELPDGRKYKRVMFDEES